MGPNTHVGAPAVRTAPRIDHGLTPLVVRLRIDSGLDHLLRPPLMGNLRAELGARHASIKWSRRHRALPQTQHGSWSRESETVAGAQSNFRPRYGCAGFEDACRAVRPPS